MAAKQCGSCGLEPVERVGLRHGQKPLRRVELSCLKAQLRRGERTLRSPTWVGCQSDGALQERGSGGDASARLRAAGGSFQLTRDRLVGCGGGRGQMPCPTVWINFPIGRLGQCEVHTPALIDWRGSVDRGANQRMTEPHGFLDREQPIRGVSRGNLDPEPFGCTPDEQRVADRLGGGDQQQEPRSGRNRFNSVLKALLEPSRQRLPRGVQQTETTGKLLYRQPTGQLQEREGIASRLGDDAIADPLVEPKHDARTQKRARVPVPEPKNLQLREPAKLPGGRARRKEKSDWLREEPPRDEGERLGRHLVQPLRVVDDAEERTLLCRPRKQRQDRQPDEESIRRRPCGPAERDLECAALWRRELLHGFEQRRTQLVQGRERELHLRLDTRGLKDPHVCCRFNGIVQERCLPDPGLAVNQQRATLAGAERGDDVIEQGALRTTPLQASRPADRIATRHRASILDKPERRVYRTAWIGTLNPIQLYITFGRT